MDIDLSTDTPPSPEHTLRLAETFAEAARRLNHQTMHHEALVLPSEAHRLIGEIATAVSRLPQLLEQQSRWLERERQAGGLAVAYGPFAGNPDLAVVRARLSLDEARTSLYEAVTALEAAASVTAALTAREDGHDDPA